MPDTMRQVHFDRFGEPGVLRVVDSERPEPRVGEVRIRVAAAGVNRADVAQREGTYAPPPGATPVLGLEVSGTVDALGPGVASAWLDREVCSLTAGGGYAEWVCVPVAHCMALPPGFDLIQAAAFPEAAMTVWSNVFDLGRLGLGGSLLVHGGTSGVGACAIGFARALGHTVYATASGPAKCNVLRHWGARAIDYREEDFVARVLTQSDGRGVDVILDMVGGDYVNRNIACLATGGRVVQIAFLGGEQASIDVFALMRKGAVLTGSLLRPRANDDKAAIVAALVERVFPLIEAGRLRPPVIDSVYPMDSAAQAHARLASSQHIGKLVLTWREEWARSPGLPPKHVSSDDHLTGVHS